jgi:hypothetical protein
MSAVRDDEPARSSAAAVRRVPWALLALWLAGGAVAVVLYRLPLPPGRLFRSLTNASHVVGFGLVAWLALRTSIHLFGERLRPRLGHYGLALVAAMALGVALEAVQIGSSRDASVADLGRNALGAGAVLAWVLSFDASARPGAWGLARAALPLRALALALVTVGFVPLALDLWATLKRNAAFPTLASFDAAWEEAFVVVEGAELERVVAPEAWREGRRSGRVGRVVFREGAYPKLELAEPVADWSGYDRLALSVFNPSEADVELRVRVHDAAHDDTYGDRFNDVARLPPGPSELTYALGEIAAGPQGRRMDLTAIAGVILFVAAPEAPVTLYLGDFRLE